MDGLGLAGGFLPSVPPNTTPQVQNAAINDVINNLNTSLKTQTFSDGTNKRYINGYFKDGFPSGDFGARLVIEGKDVVTDGSDNSNKIFDWDYTDGNLRFYKGGVPYLRIGGSDGMKVAKDGINVDTATDNQLIFNSSQNVLKIVSTGVVTMPAWTVPATKTTAISEAVSAGNFITIKTGLTGVFMVTGFVTNSNSTFPLDSGLRVELTNLTGSILAQSNFYISTYNGVVEIARLAFNPTASPIVLDALSIRYYILQESAI